MILSISSVYLIVSPTKKERVTKPFPLDPKHFVYGKIPIQSQGPWQPKKKKKNQYLVTFYN